MSFFRWFDRIGNIGVKGKYNPWEIYLTRKLNILSFVGIFNVSVTLILFLIIGISDFTIEFVATIIAGSFVPLLNRYKNYIWAGYLFYLIGIVLFFVISLKMGLDSMAMLYYFPILISLV